MQQHKQLVLSGVKRSIYLNSLYLDQILQADEGKLLEQYDHYLQMTQYNPFYYSEQQLFHFQEKDEKRYVVVNYVNCDRVTALPAQPVPEEKYRKIIGQDTIVEYRLMLMNSKKEKLAEVPYQEFLSKLTEGVSMLDARYIILQPMSKEQIRQLL